MILAQLASRRYKGIEQVAIRCVSGKMACLNMEYPVPHMFGYLNVLLIVFSALVFFRTFQMRSSWRMCFLDRTPSAGWLKQPIR